MPNPEWIAQQEKNPNAMQTIVNGTLIIEPGAEFSKRERMLFAVGSIPIRPNDVFFPTEPERHFEMESRGPWNIISKIRGLAVKVYREPEDCGEDVLKVLIYGDRTLSNARESGYQMEGTVSIKGQKQRAFTSSKLFSTPDGKLCDVAILYVC